MREWVLFYPERPFTANVYRNWHHYEKAKNTKRWRDAFCWLAKEAQIPRLDAIEVEVTPILSGRGRDQDVAGCAPSAKAGIDGLTDAGVLLDDSPKFLKRLIFNASERGEVGLRVIVREL